MKTPGHQNTGVQLGGGVVVYFAGGVVCQQIPRHVVIHPKAPQQHDDGVNFQVLCQHEANQVGIADFGGNCSPVMFGTFVGQSPWGL